MGITGVSLCVSVVLALHIEFALEFAFPFTCIALLLMCALDATCILFTLLLFGRQVHLAARDRTEYEASVLFLDKKSKSGSCLQRFSKAIRNLFRFFFAHDDFLATLSQEPPYPEPERPQPSETVSVEEAASSVENFDSADTLIRRWFCCRGWKKGPLKEA